MILRLIPILLITWLAWRQSYYGQILLFSIFALLQALPMKDISVIANISFSPLLIIIAKQLMNGWECNRFAIILLSSCISSIPCSFLTVVLSIGVLVAIFPTEVELIISLSVAWWLCSKLSSLVKAYEIPQIFSVICLIILQSFHTHSDRNEDVFDVRSTFNVFAVIACTLAVILCSSVALVDVISSVLHELRYKLPINQKTLLRNTSFVLTTIVTLWLYLFPQIYNTVGQHAFVWISNFLQLNNYLAAKLCLYWIVVLLLSVPVAQYVMDRWNLNKTEGRKLFHAIALILFLPPLSRRELNVFVCFAFGITFAIFVWLEYVRMYLWDNQQSALNQYYGLFVTDEEMQIPNHSVAITSHMSLLLGCASTLWLYTYLMNDGTVFEDSELRIIRYFGLITVGVGDSMAAIIGSRFGKLKWPRSKKSYIGSTAAFISMCLFTIIIIKYEEQRMEQINFIALFSALFLTTIVEVMIPGNDNLMLPLYCTIVYTLLIRIFKL